MSPAIAQLTTGSISGVVTDTTRSVIPAAKITLTAEATSAVREATSDGEGKFRFSAVQPGSYTLTIEQSSFKRYVNKNLQLSPDENLAVGNIQLAIGSNTQSVTVTTEDATVQLASTERSGGSLRGR